MTLQFISLFFVTDKTHLGQTEVLIHSLTNICFPPPPLTLVFFTQTNQEKFLFRSQQLRCSAGVYTDLSQLLTVKSVQNTTQYLGGLQIAQGPILADLALLAQGWSGDRDHRDWKYHVLAWCIQTPSSLGRQKNNSGFVVVTDYVFLFVFYFVLFFFRCPFGSVLRYCSEFLTTGMYRLY